MFGVGSHARLRAKTPSPPMEWLCIDPILIEQLLRTVVQRTRSGTSPMAGVKVFLGGILLVVNKQPKMKQPDSSITSLVKRFEVYFICIIQLNKSRRVIELVALATCRIPKQGVILFEIKQNSAVRITLACI